MVSPLESPTLPDTRGYTAPISQGEERWYGEHGSGRHPYGQLQKSARHSQCQADRHSQCQADQADHFENGGEE